MFGASARPSRQLCLIAGGRTEPATGKLGGRPESPEDLEGSEMNAATNWYDLVSIQTRHVESAIDGPVSIQDLVSSRGGLEYGRDRIFVQEAVARVAAKNRCQWTSLIEEDGSGFLQIGVPPPVFSAPYGVGRRCESGFVEVGAPVNGYGHFGQTPDEVATPAVRIEQRAVERVRFDVGDGLYGETLFDSIVHGFAGEAWVEEKDAERDRRGERERDPVSPAGLSRCVGSP